MRTDEIFGMVDDALDNMEVRNPRAAPSLKRARPRSIPPMRVSTSRDAAPDGVEYANVVNVPKNVLSMVAATMEKDTSRLNQLFLRHLLPLLLSYETSTGYARAALKEGLDIEIDFDGGLRDCVDFVGYLNVVMHFVKHSRLPVSVKKRFVNHFSDKLAEQAVLKLIETNKVQTHQQQMRELQAVVYERKANKMTTHTNEKPEQSAGPTAAIKRKRKPR